MGEYAVGFYVCLLTNRDTLDQAEGDATRDLRDVLRSEGFTHEVAGITTLHTITVPQGELEGG